MRIGQGWDVHRLEKGLRLVIGGTDIDFDKGCVAHSDGDVLAHAVIDALLGAAALGDIGSHFPDTSEEWKGACSMDLLRTTSSLLMKNRFRIINVDSTVILQRPKLRPYIETMRKNIAEALGVEPSSVSVKAKTAEELDSIGQSLAIEASAAVLVEEIDDRP